MKIIVLFVVSFFTANAWSFEVDPDVCPQILVQNENTLICSKSAYIVMSKENAFANVNQMPFETYDHLSFGYPDDSISIIYSYNKTIKNPAGVLIGYLNIFAIANDETGSRTQLNIYYGVNGKVLGGKSHDF